MVKRKKKKVHKTRSKVQKVQIVRPPRLSDEDALFVAYYFLYEFKGSYPFIKMNQGHLTELPGELFKHLVRNILVIQGGHIERQIIDCLRLMTKVQIIKQTYVNFPILKKRKDLDERIIFMYTKLKAIQSGWKTLETILPMETQKMDNVEQNDVVKEEVVEDTIEKSETPTYKSIEEYTTLTGKRFRRKKSDKAMGLTREEAFQNKFGS
jgi:hypothetical protein